MRRYKRLPSDVQRFRFVTKPAPPRPGEPRVDAPDAFTPSHSVEVPGTSTTKKSKATTKTNPYDDPKFASHVRYLSANSLADGFVPCNANDTSSCVTRFAPINF